MKRIEKHVSFAVYAYAVRDYQARMRVTAIHRRINYKHQFVNEAPFMPGWDLQRIYKAVPERYKSKDVLFAESHHGIFKI